MTPKLPQLEKKKLESLLRRKKEAIKAFKAGKLRVYKTSTALFKDLNS